MGVHATTVVKRSLARARLSRADANDFDDDANDFDDGCSVKKCLDGADLEQLINTMSAMTLKIFMVLVMMTMMMMLCDGL